MATSSKKSGLNHSGGYTLLFAVLTAALVLGVAVFILSISRGQYILASTARESTYAIYAADSGIECAFLAAVNKQVTSDRGGSISCAGHGSAQIAAFEPSANVSGLHSVSKQSVTLNLGDGKCVAITYISGTNSKNLPVTQIESRGYNYCIVTEPPPNEIWGPDTSNPKIVERALRFTSTGLDLLAPTTP